MPRVRAPLALAPLAASLALALAGCLAGPEGDPASASSDPEPAPTAAALPEDIALSRSVTASHYNPAGMLDWPGAEIDAELGPGDYRVLVDAYAVTQDGFDLAVRFARA